jgi:hypothetical protein
MKIYFLCGLYQLKVDEIRKVVDSELGFAVDLPYRKNESKVSNFQGIFRKSLSF